MPRCEAPRRHPHTLELQNTSHIRLVSPADVSGLSVSTQTSRDGVWVYEGVGHHVSLDWMCNQAVNPKVPCQRSGSAGSVALQSVSLTLSSLQSTKLQVSFRGKQKLFFKPVPRCPGPSCACRGLVRLSELSDGLGFKLQSEASGKRAAASGRLLCPPPPTSRLSDLSSGKPSDT